MADQAYDLSGLVEAVDIEVLADGIFVGEIFLCENLIDCDDQRRMLIVLRSEKSSLSQRDSHHREIIRLDDIVDGPIHIIFTGRFWLTLEPEELLIIPTQGSRAPGLRDACNPRK